MTETFLIIALVLGAIFFLGSCVQAVLQGSVRVASYRWSSLSEWWSGKRYHRADSPLAFYTGVIVRLAAAGYCIYLLNTV